MRDSNPRVLADPDYKSGAVNLCANSALVSAVLDLNQRFPPPKGGAIPGFANGCLVAEMGFEPHDLDLMRVASYLAALLRNLSGGKGGT